MINNNEKLVKVSREEEQISDINNDLLEILKNNNCNKKSDCSRKTIYNTV